MSYCSKCIHREVCGHEGVDDSAMTYCADRLLVCCDDYISRDDYINRQAAIKIVDCLSDDVASSVLGGVERAVKELKKLPVIKKQSLSSIPTLFVKGYWVYNEKESDAIIETYNCSICGYTRTIDSLIETTPNFCEHCGAKNKIK